jgi:hypothetical protein
MGPPPVDLLDELCKKLRAIGADIDRQSQEALKAARLANSPEVLLPEPAWIQERFLAPVLVFACSWLRAQRPNPTSHKSAEAREAFQRIAEEIIQMCLPPPAMQPIWPAGKSARQAKAGHRKKTFDPESPGSFSDVEIQIRRPLSQAEIQLLRILFGEQYADELLGMRDPPEAAGTATEFNHNLGIIGRALPGRYRYIFHSRLRWLREELRAALNEEIETLLDGYAEPAAESPMPSRSVRAPEHRHRPAHRCFPGARVSGHEKAYSERRHRSGSRPQGKLGADEIPK